jgi:hypothetical protein
MTPDDRIRDTPGDDEDFSGFYDPGDEEDFGDSPSDPPVTKTLLPAATPVPDRQFESDLAAFSTQGLQFGADGFESPDCRLDNTSFAGRAIILSPLLRSAVASVGVVVRTWQDRAEFPVQHGRTIHFTGYRLYQQDLLIPFRISDLLRGQSTQTPLKISMRDLINWLRWSRSAHSRNRLRGSLLSLAMARFEVTSFSYERTRFRLFDSLQVEGDEIIGKLSGGFLKFQDATDANPRGTFIPIERWRALRCGLETWLAGWVLSTKCDTPIALQTLHDHCGTSHQHVGEFGRDVRRALDRLKAVGLIINWKMKPGNRLTSGYISITKPARTR